MPKVENKPSILITTAEEFTAAFSVCASVILAAFAATDNQRHDIFNTNFEAGGAILALIFAVAFGVAATRNIRKLKN